jgi:hypothetical protein
MKALISAYNEAAKCTWCERENEGVTVEFDGSFLKKGPLCFKCLQQAVKVHHKQAKSTKPTAATE